MNDNTNNVTACIDALRRYWDGRVECSTNGKVWVGPLDVTRLVEDPDIEPDVLVEHIEDLGNDLTTAQIQALRAEASSAGDSEMVLTCDRALARSEPDRARCAQVIEAAEAMGDA